jgi:hypothetical protein
MHRDNKDYKNDVISFSNKELIIQGGWEVLGRTGVLRGSSGCLNTGSWCFFLVGARKIRELVLPSSGC